MKTRNQGLTQRDILFAGINGAIFGVMMASITKNLDVLSLHPTFLIAIFVFLAILGINVGYFLSRVLAPFFFQLAKFGAVGASNFSIDIGVYSLLILLTGIVSGVFIPIFKGLSFVVAVINSYLWNKHWSFEDKSKEDVGKEFIQFLVVSIIGMVVNVGIVHFLVNILGTIGEIDEKIWATLSASISAIVVLSWNFIGYKFIVFKKNKTTNTQLSK